MENFVVVKKLDNVMRDEIQETLDIIRHNVVRGDLKAVTSSFDCAYDIALTTIQQFDLYQILNTSHDYLEQQLAFVKKFEQIFYEKFISEHTRKSISKVKDRFKDCIIKKYDIYFGDIQTVVDIDSAFKLFKEYTEFVINLYDGIVPKIEEHLSKEGEELTNFINITNLKGKVEYIPTLGDVPLKKLKFVRQYNQCKEALVVIDKWLSLKVAETNVPIDIPYDELY